MTLRSFEDATGDATIETDVVIVGSGPGGAAMARTLAERGARVVVLEEGPSTSRFRPNMPNTMRFHLQERGNMVAFGNAVIPIGAGRGVGGGSLVNSAICWRTPSPVLADWTERLGDDRYSAEAMDSVYGELEALLEIGETPDDIAGENNRLIVRGAKKLGLPGGYLRRNTPRCKGCGVCNYGCPSGGKSSVDRNLIPMARAAGAVVQADVKVDTVLVEGGRAAGVVGTVSDTDTFEPVGRLTVKASQVVVCAGGIGTPRLLHMAGLAERLGPRLGKGLHLHPGNAVLGLCETDVHMWKGATQGAYFEDPALPGMLPHTLSMPVGTVLLTLNAAGTPVEEAMKLVPRMCGCVVMISDKSEGAVWASAEGRARITYTFSDAEVDEIKRGMGRVADVLVAGGAKRLLVPVRGVGWCENPAEVRQKLAASQLADFNMYASHPTATCRLSRDIETGVVDINGEAHGLPGLFIADSSVFPTSLGVNPQLTTMAVATIIGRHMVLA